MDAVDRSSVNADVGGDFEAFGMVDDRLCQKGPLSGWNRRVFLGDENENAFAFHPRCDEIEGLIMFHEDEKERNRRDEDPLLDEKPPRNAGTDRFHKRFKARLGLRKEFRLHLDLLFDHRGPFYGAPRQILTSFFAVHYEASLIWRVRRGALQAVAPWYWVGSSLICALLLVARPVQAQVEGQAGLLPQAWAKAELGGDQSEKREENRFWSPIGAAAKVEVPTGPVRLGFGFAGSIDLDVQYLNAHSKRTTTEFAPVEAVLALASKAGPRYDADEDTGGHKKQAIAAVPDGQVLSRDPALWFPGLNLGIGRFFLSADPDGFLHEASGNGAVSQAVWSGRSRSMRFSGFFVGVEGDRPLGHVTRDDPVHYGLSIEGKFDFFRFGALFSHFRSPGRGADPGFSVGPYLIRAADPARAEFRVDYALLRAEVSADDFIVRATLGGNHGRRFDSTPSDVSAPTSPRSISGGFAYLGGELRLARSEKNGDTCPGSAMPRNCIAERRFASSLEISALHVTKDNDDGDQRDTSFGPIAAAPRVMGGMASIFLSGMPPQNDSLPFANSRLRSSVTAPTMNLGDRTDDVPLPSYTSGGLTMGGIGFGTDTHQGRLDIFANYADLSRGLGVELIVAGTIPLWRDAVSTRDGRLVVSWTEATYRPSDWKTNRLTGILEKPRRTWYRRFLIGLSMAL